MKLHLFGLAMLLACASADDSRQARARAGPTIVDIDSLTVTDSIGLPAGGSNRIRIAYWSGDRMIYCALATIASVDGIPEPIITDERACHDVALLEVDSVRFETGRVIPPEQLRDETTIRIEAKPSSP